MPPGFTNSLFILQAVDLAVAGTYLAIGKALKSLARPPIQLASAVQFQISRLKLLRPDCEIYGRFGHVG